MADREDIPRNLAGILLAVLGICMLVYDSTQDWDTIWATAAGIKLILVAIIFLLWGPLKRLDARHKTPKD
jgi:protein-S-isoprenylcysteine O-methyltransferase Ste14